MLIVLVLIIAIACLPFAIQVFCTAAINVGAAIPDASRTITEAVTNNLLGTPKPDTAQIDDVYPTCIVCGHIGPDVYIVDKKCILCWDKK